MRQDDHSLIYEARACAEGLVSLLSNMPDKPLDAVHPFDLLMLIQPITDRLNRVLEDRPARA